MAPRKRSAGASSQKAHVSIDLTADAKDVTVVGHVPAHGDYLPVQPDTVSWRLTPAMLSGAEPLPNKPQAKRAADAYAHMTDADLSACFADGIDADQAAVDTVLSRIDDGGVSSLQEAPKQRAGTRRTSACRKAAEPVFSLSALTSLLRRQDCAALMSDRKHPNVVKRLLEQGHAEIVLAYACAVPDLLPQSHSLLLGHLLQAPVQDEAVLALCARPVVAPADAHSILAAMDAEQSVQLVNVLHGALQRPLREEDTNVEQERAALQWLSLLCVQRHAAIGDSDTAAIKATAALLAPVQQTIEARCAMSAELGAISALAASLLHTARAHRRGDPRSVAELTSSAVADGALCPGAYVVEALPF